MAEMEFSDDDMGPMSSDDSSNETEGVDYSTAEMGEDGEFYASRGGSRGGRSGRRSGAGSAKDSSIYGVFADGGDYKGGDRMERRKMKASDVNKPMNFVTSAIKMCGC